MGPIRSEYCPYCGRLHYRIRLLGRTARYGCSKRILSWTAFEDSDAENENE